MEQVRKFSQAYQQTPWRKQLQVIVSFLLGLVVVALVAGIYLSVTARAATIGRQIQEMQIRIRGSHRVDYVEAETPIDPADPSGGAQEETVPIEELRIQIADLEARLAYLNSATSMHERAVKLGFVPTTPESTLYIKVPGYQGKQVVNLAPPPAPVTTHTVVLSPAYRESLLDWLGHQLTLASRQFTQEEKP